ncbi:MAG TPA: hypothetical protein VMR81_02355 [Patescibacteria group bacterium]|jgi:hypothetical protein|nr:hypothetical protein [Patescibacteria group bacterium]
MNKKIVVAIVIILLLLLGGGAYMMLGKSMKAPAPETLTQVSPTANPTGTTAMVTTATAAQTQGTLKNLLSIGKPVSCTFTTQDGNTTGTVYTVQGKMSGDFTTKSQGNTITAHMIVDSGYSYVWTGMTKMGFKIALADAPKPSTTPGANQGVGMNETVSYSCTDWAPHMSQFTLPTDIKFTTITIPGAATTGTSATGTGTANAACSACNSLPAGAAQTACKTQLHCP